MRLRWEREGKSESADVSVPGEITHRHESDEVSKEGEDALASIERSPTLIDQLVTTIWVLLNLGIVVGIVFVNKSIVSDYSNSGIVMTLVHMWTTCLAMTGAEVSGVFKVKQIPYRQVFFLALLNSCAIVCSNLSLQYSPVTVYQIFKVLITPAVAIFQFFFLGPTSYASVLSLILVTIGGVVSAVTNSDASVTVFCIIINITATILSALFQIMMAKKMKDLKATPNQLLFMQAPLNCIFLFIFMSGLESKSFARLYDPKFLAVVFVGSLLAPLVNLSQIHVIHRTSPLTYAVLSQFKSSTIFLGSIVFLNEHPSRESIIGLVILHVGVLWYIISKHSSSRSTPSSGPNTQQPLSAMNQVKYIIDKQTLYGKNTNDPPLATVKRNFTKMSYTRMFMLAIVGIPIIVLFLAILWKPPDVPDYSVNFTFHPTPKIVHYIWANEHQSSEIPINVFVSVAATYNYLKPDTIYWHHSGTCNFTGYWWNKIKALVTMNVSPIPNKIFGKSPKWIQHKTDIMRLEIVNQMGGIYLDTDVIPLRSFDDLIAEGRPVMGLQNGKTRTITSSACNAVIITPPNATFNKIWYDKYETDYRPKCWQCNSVETPGYLSYKYPNLIRVLPDDQLFSPDWTRCDLLFDHGKSIDVSDHYAVHLWGSMCMGDRKITLDYINNDNSTFSGIARPLVASKYLSQLDDCMKLNTKCPILPSPFAAPKAKSLSLLL